MPQVNLSDGSFIETMDWGGEGEPLILLAGLNRTLHCYAELAPLIQRRRVLGITRRGFGASRNCEDDYSHDRLVQDVIDVMDYLQIEQADFIGHSFASQEIRLLAERSSEKVRSVVLLDGYDTSDDLRLIAEWAPPAPPQPSKQDLASAYDFGLYYERNFGGVLPLAEIEASYTFDETGQISGEDVNPEAIAAIVGGFVPQDWSVLTMPALAMFMDARSPEHYAPTYLRMNEEDQAAFRLFFEKAMTRKHGQIQSFKRAVPHARVEKINDSGHDFYLTHKNQVFSLINEFL